MSLLIRKADNGYIVETTKPSPIESSIGMTNTRVFVTGDALLAYVSQVMIDPCVGVPVESPEQPSYIHPEKDIFNLSEDEDSTETMIESDPITPMADLNPTQQDNYFDGLPNGQAQE